MRRTGLYTHLTHSYFPFLISGVIPGWLEGKSCWIIYEIIKIITHTMSAVCACRK